MPYTHHTGVLETLAENEPKTLAIMHGSTYYGDGAQALRELAIVMRDVLGPKAQQGETPSTGTGKPEASDDSHATDKGVKKSSSRQVFWVYTSTPTGRNGNCGQGGKQQLWLHAGEMRKECFMRALRMLPCAILLFSIASCSRRPTDERVDVKTALLPEVAPNDTAFSGYQPAKPYTVTDNTILARTVFQAAAAPGTNMEVRDWKLPPGKQTTPVTLPGAALIEVRSGTGVLQAGNQRQELQLGAIVAVSQDQSFILTNSGQLTLTMRVYIVSGS